MIQLPTRRQAQQGHDNHSFTYYSQASLEMKGEKELKALLDILALDSSVYARIQVSVLQTIYCLWTNSASQSSTSKLELRKLLYYN